MPRSCGRCGPVAAAALQGPDDLLETRSVRHYARSLRTTANPSQEPALSAPELRAHLAQSPKSRVRHSNALKRPQASPVPLARSQLRVRSEGHSKPACDPGEQKRGNRRRQSGPRQLSARLRRAQSYLLMRPSQNQSYVSCWNGSFEAVEQHHKLAAHLADSYSPCRQPSLRYVHQGVNPLGCARCYARTSPHRLLRGAPEPSRSTDTLRTYPYVNLEPLRFHIGRGGEPLRFTYDRGG